MHFFDKINVQYDEGIIKSPSSRWIFVDEGKLVL